jgi:hypothetical protein
MTCRPRNRSSTALAGVLLLGVTLTGCYRATVDTGRNPSGQVIQNQWAHSFIAGLVPPSTVETAGRCPAGVARVETQLSFLNMVANAVTFGIYSPMTITVQCAAPGTALNTGGVGADRIIGLPEGADRADLENALNDAVKRARADNQPVVVTFPSLE